MYMKNPDGQGQSGINKAKLQISGCRNSGSRSVHLKASTASLIEFFCQKQKRNRTAIIMLPVVSIFENNQKS